LTVTDKQTIRKILNIKHTKNTHINTVGIKENKQLNIQQKQNYPGSVASYDSRPGNEVGLFYNGPECQTGQAHSSFSTAGIDIPAPPGGTARRSCYALACWELVDDQHAINHYFPPQKSQICFRQVTTNTCVAHSVYRQNAYHTTATNKD